MVLSYVYCSIVWLILPILNSPFSHACAALESLIYSSESVPDKRFCLPHVALESLIHSSDSVHPKWPVLSHCFEKSGSFDDSFKWEDWQNDSPIRVPCCGISIDLFKFDTVTLIVVKWAKITYRPKFYNFIV